MMDRYLDLDLLVNGSMDAMLLILTARLINLPLKKKRILAGVLAGEVPVLLAAYLPKSSVFELSKFLIPFLMVWLAYPRHSGRTYGKAVLLFWILSASLGGFVYALWGWFRFDGNTSETLRLGFENLWLLPIVVCLWWMGQRVWHKWTNAALHLRPSLHQLTIDFGAGPIQITAMLDTGNQLRDPLTDVPVILVEEEIAATVLPENLQAAITAPWRELEDPWVWLWKTDPGLMKSLVFIPFQSVGHKSWLLGIRPQRVVCDSQGQKEIKATLALVQHKLSPDGAYQALLHAEHVQGAEDL